MSNNKYVIVGSEVDQAAYYLHDDGTIDDQKGTDGQPLNVEFIGKLMVELSKRGKKGVSRTELNKLENQVRHALMVQDFSVQNGGAELTEAERADLLDRTDVEIEFETRRRFSTAGDRNTRILVVPSDETLEITDALLKAQGNAEGFRPPLSYELDKALMMASLQRDILEIVREFAPKAKAAFPQQWTQQIQTALEKHVVDTLKDRCIFKDSGGQPAQDVKNEIMASPIRAFYRSVGIYATNMCR